MIRRLLVLLTVLRLVACSAPQRETRRYTIEQFLDTESILGGSFSPDEKTIAYSSDASGVYNYGEGFTGVGGFGYFDTVRKTYRIFTPPKILKWSVSAIHVGSDAVWMALVNNGEYGGSSGGLPRFDR